MVAVVHTPAAQVGAAAQHSPSTQVDAAQAVAALVLSYTFEAAVQMPAAVVVPAPSMSPQVAALQHSPSVQVEAAQAVEALLAS